MKKETFVILALSVLGGLIFALGMCMCLLPEWNMFNIGVGFSIFGAIVLIVAFITYRRALGRGRIRFNLKVIGRVLYGIIASLVLGIGMCLIMVYDLLIPGIIVGIVGIMMLLCLIPICIGLK